jgi:hypothetical protein
MAVKIELKRSAVPGKAPTIDQVDLGELAVNTYDGKIYFKRDTGVSQSIVEIASTSGSISTASYADYAATAGSASTSLFANNAGNANTATSASYSLTSSFSVSSSNAVSSSYALSSSYAVSASHAPTSLTASYAITSSYALTASSADDFLVRGNITASNALFSGTITAQTLQVVTISSSVVYSSGSNIFGNQLSNTQQLTGSTSITGSLSVYGSSSFYGPVNITNLTGSLFGTSSRSISSSIADTASLAPAYTLTSSFNSFTGSYLIDSASFSSSIALLSGSFLQTSASLSASISLLSGSFLTFSSSYTTASFTGSFTGVGNLTGSFTGAATLTGSYLGTGSLSGSFTGSFTGNFSGSIANIAGTPTYIPLFNTTNTLATSSIFQSGSFSVIINQTGNTSDAPEALYVWQPSTTSYNVISGKGNLDNYLQLNIQNTNQGTNASSDVVATANNGNESGNYVNMGINSENYSGFLGGPNDAYVFNTGSEFHIGNASPNKHLGFFVGGSDVTANNKLQLNPNNEHSITGSLEISGSLKVNRGITGSLFGTASWAMSSSVAISASTAVSSSTAATASSADNFFVRGNVTASNALISGTITAQTLVVQTVTSSVIYSSGSNIFGNSLSNTQQFTGSTSITGSLVVNGPIDVIGDSTLQGNQFNEGTYWRAVSGSNFPSLPWRAITYGNGLFVAAAQRSGAAVSTTGSIATSPDGVNWTFRTLPSLTSLINVTYQNGIFVAVGHLNQRSFYSYDGINWFNGVGLGGQGYGITYGKDKFVVTKIDNSLNRIDISYNGVNWQGVSTPATMDLPWTSVTYANDRYVAVAESTVSGSIAISSDGISWNNVTRPSAGTLTTYNITYGKGLFVVTCNQGKVMTSPDGINWTVRDTPLTGLIWKCIFAGGVFIAAGCFSTSQNRFIYSVDGITWEEAITPALNDWSGFAYGNGLLLGVSFNGTNSSALIVSSGVMNSFITQNDNITHGRQIYTDGLILSGSFNISGSQRITGSLNVNSGITGSLFGTSSWAVSASHAPSALTSSFAVSASYAVSSSNSVSSSYALSSSVSVSSSYALSSSVSVSSSYALSGSNSISASYAISASNAQSASVSVSSSYALSSSFAVSSSNAVSSSYAFSASYSQTSSFSLNTISASYALTASHALTASSADDFFVRGNLTASNALISNTLTAQTLVVQTVTSSIVYSSGSNIFGNQLTNTQQFTGSVSVTGSLTVNGASTFNGRVTANNLTGSLFGTASWALNATTASHAPTALSASYAISASNALSSSYAFSSSNAISSSNSITASFAFNAGLLDGTGSRVFATTGSNVFIGSQTVTGSLFTSGSNTLIGTTFLTGALNISGSETINGYIQFEPVTTNINNSISASYIYVSGSTQDLYFTQNSKGYNNTTRLRWLEGNLYTGLLNGGLITTQSSTVYNVSSGSGIIVNLNASLNDNPYPTIQYLNWGNLTASIAPLTASYQQAFVSIDSTGNIFQQGTPYSDGQFDTVINVGVVLFQNGSTINAVKTQPSVAYGFEQSQNIFNRAFGPLKLSGFTLAPSGSSTGSLVVGSGTAYAPGSNYTIDPNNPSYAIDPGTQTSKIYRYYQSGSSWVYLTNAGAGFGAIDPQNYSNNGTLTNVGAGNWSIQRVFWFPNSVAKAIIVYYGNNIYTTEADAIANLNIESFVEAPNTAANAVYLGAIVINGTGVFTSANDFTILPGGLFRQVGGSGGGGSVITQTLAGLSDVSISGPTNLQPFAYSTTAGKWINTSIISASLVGNASTATSASFSISASYALSSSNAQTSSHALFAISSSFAATASSADDFLVRSNLTASNALINNTLTVQTIVAQTITSSTDFVTGSTRFGSLLSNTHQFTGSVSITGSLSLNNVPIPTGTGASGQVTYWTGANTQTGSNNLFWDATNSRLGLNVVAPTATVQISGSSNSNLLLAGSPISSSIFSISGSGQVNVGVPFIFNATPRSFNVYGESLFQTANGAPNSVYIGSNTSTTVGAGLLVTPTQLISNQNNGTFTIIGDNINIGSRIILNARNLDTGSLILGANNINTVKIYGTGRVGIQTGGTFVDSGENLQVSGSAKITNNLTVTGSFIVVTGSLREFEVRQTGVDIGSVITDFHTVTGSLNISGSLRATSITSSLLGTASYAVQALSSSFAVSASQAVSSSFTVSSSQAVSSSYALSSSNSITSSFAISSSQATTASFVLNAVSASFALTASSVNPLFQNVELYGRLTNLSASVILQSSASAQANALEIRTPGGSTVIQLRNNGTAQFNDLVQTPYLTGLSDGPVVTNSTGWMFGPSFAIAASAKVHISGSTNNSVLFRIDSPSFNNILRVSGSGFIGVNQELPIFNLDVSGSGRYTQGLQVTGSLNAPIITGSLFGTASWAQNAQTASFVLNAISASFAATASSADNFLVRQNLTSSNAVVTGTLTAQTLVVQTVTSSIVYSSGSNIFGNDLANRQILTGSVSITGSLTVNGPSTFNGPVTANNLTGSLFGTASYATQALSASFATTASFAASGSISVSSSYALSSSYAINASSGSNFVITNTYRFNGSLNDSATVISSIAGTNNLFTQPTGSFTAGFYKYTVTNGTNARTGEVMAVWNGGNVEFTDFSTVDLGSTLVVTASVVIASAEAQFNIITNTSGWNIKALATYL